MAASSQISAHSPEGGPGNVSLAASKSLSHSQLHERVKNAPGDIVQNFIPERSVNVFVGDSGLGKTPLHAQEGVCVAAGIPFLGLETRRGIVLYCDYENSQKGFDLLLDRLKEHLELEAIPDTFRYLSQPDNNSILLEIQLWRGLYPELPILVICDSLRGFNSKAETKNENAAVMISGLERWATAYNCAFVLIHHLRKDNPQEKASPLLTTDVMEWLTASAGARALVNQSMVRFGIDNEALGGSELVIKGHYKLTGAIGPLFLGRVRDEDGEPIGYRRVSGLALLDSEQQGVFTKLPDEFRFKDLERTSGKNPKIVAGWLLAWRCAEVVILTGEHKQKRYRKVPAAALVAETKKPAAKSKRKSPRDLAEDWYKTLSPGTVFTPQEMTKQCGNGSTATYLRVIERWISDGRVKKLDAAPLIFNSRLEITKRAA
jgi:AAA domain-containing protein